MKREIDAITILEEIRDELNNGVTSRAIALIDFIESNGDILTDIEEQLLTEELNGI